MNFRDRLRLLRTAFTPQAAAQQGAVNFGTTDHEMLSRAFGSHSPSGKTVDEKSILGVSAAFGCMRILSETIGSMPWGIYLDDGKGNATRARDHELEAVLCQSPNREQTPVEYKESKALNLVQAGNTYSYIERAGGSVMALSPIESRFVKPMIKKGGNSVLDVAEGSVFFRVNDRGQPEDMPREKIWQIKGFGANMLEGVSPLGAAAQALGFAMATADFGSAFFRQGGHPSGVVTIEGKLKDDQREEARRALQMLMGGLGNQHKFVLLEGGMKPVPWANTPLKDLEFLLLLQFSVPEICRFFRVPPHMVADLSRATFSNIEHLSQEFVMFTLMPYFTRFEASVSKWLMRPKDRGKYFLRFNAEGLLRADSKGRAEFYASALQNGWMNRNEVRAKENLNKQDGLDGFTVQTNMAPVDRLDDMVDAATTPPAPPPAPKPPPANVVLTVVPEREMKATFNSGPVHVAAAQVKAGDVRVDVAAPQVTVEPAQFHAGDVHVSHDNSAVKAVEMLGELVDGLRKSQGETRDLAARLLDKDNQ